MGSSNFHFGGYETAWTGLVEEHLWARFRQLTQEHSSPASIEH